LEDLRELPRLEGGRPSVVPDKTAAFPVEGDMEMLKHMTNATKAQLVAAVNAIVLCLQVFGVPINNAQQAAIGVAANAVFGVWIAMTYKNAEPRADDDAVVAGAAAATN
jgi:hypothetical protein